MDTKRGSIVPDNKRKISYTWKGVKFVMSFSFVAETILFFSVKNPKIHTWFNPACILFCYSWWSNAKYDMEFSDT